jgi:hypothetical protein
MRILVFLVVLALPVTAHAECYEEVRAAAHKLQPWYAVRSMPWRAAHLDKLSRAVCAASAETGVSPLLAIAVARRESSLLPRVGLGKKVGSRGEQGYFQVLPGSPAARLGACDQTEPACNALSALRYMRALQTRCGEDPWVWVGAYGAGHCPTPLEARRWGVVRVARRFYCEVADCDTGWPL